MTRVVVFNEPQVLTETVESWANRPLVTVRPLVVGTLTAPKSMSVAGGRSKKNGPSRDLTRDCPGWRACQKEVWRCVFKLAELNVSVNGNLTISNAARETSSCQACQG